MERVTYKLSLDIKKNYHNRVMLGAIAGENRSRRIQITLTEAGKPFMCEDTCQATIYVLKPNQALPSVNGAVISENVITYDILGSDVDTPGVVTFQLKVTTEEEGQPVVLITTTFEADVEGNIIDDSGAPSQPTFTALDQALMKVAAVQEAFEEEIPKVEEALETIQELVDRETETLDKAEEFSKNAEQSAADAEANAYMTAQSEANAEQYRDEAKQFRDEAESFVKAPEWDDIHNKPDTFPPSDHNHNDLYYRKDEVDTALDEKANADDVYTKTEIDNKKATPTEYGFVKPDNKTTFINTKGELEALGGGGTGGDAVWGDIKGDIRKQTDLMDALDEKANADDVYTKTEVDTALNSKADTDNVYSKDDVYTKDEVDALIPTGDGIIYLTQAEYEALGDAVLTDNKTYGIADVDNYPEAESEEF